MQCITEIKRLVQGLWPVLTILVISTCLFTTATFGGNKMEHLYNINEAQGLEPQVFDIGSSSSLSLFSVPQDNAIGTNDLNNAITLLSFNKSRVTFDKYFKNAFEQVGGGGEFIPLISQEAIGFGQTRRFVIYNFRSKQHERYRIAASIDESIQKIAIADARQRHFIFEIKEYNKNSEDHHDYVTHLLLMDLSEKEAKQIKEMNKGKGVTWSVAFGKIFLYYIGKDQLQVLTTNFELSNHPLADAIKQNKGKINFTRIQTHPSLPFAILFAGDEGSTFISWTPGKAPHRLFSGADQFSFSPDGKWVTFRCDRTDPAKTYLMPVSEKYPNYLGSPILLSNNYFNANNFGWTTNPISFVGSSLNKIYRWELTNEAHPESDKATFHDYIVDHDLEKLTKEKRQGLGEKHK